MTFQVEITPVAEGQIEQAYRWYQKQNPNFAERWFRGLMNAIATLQEKPHRCSLAVEHEIFPEESVNCYTVNPKACTESSLQFEIQQFMCYTCAIVLNHHSQ